MFFPDAVTEDEIESIIGNLNSRKAIGPNSIPTNILKEFKNRLKIPLTIIINISFHTGIFPEQCKIAHIMPIFKKGDTLDSSIPTSILKEFKNRLKIPLTIIINISFHTGIFPEQCKIAHIMPIFKKGDTLDSSNYRPISPLSNMSKILEKARYTRLYKFFTNLSVYTKSSLVSEISTQKIMLLPVLQKK